MRILHGVKKIELVKFYNDYNCQNKKQNKIPRSREKNSSLAGKAKERKTLVRLQLDKPTTRLNSPRKKGNFVCDFVTSGEVKFPNDLASGKSLLFSLTHPFLSSKNLIVFFFFLSLFFAKFY